MFKSARQLIKKHPLIVFFTLAYAISWLIWSPLIASGLDWIETSLPPSWHFLGSFGPLLAAIIVTSLMHGKSGIRDILKRMFDLRAGTKWLIFSLLSAPTLFLFAFLILSLIHQRWLELGQFGNLPEMPEIGWLAGWIIFILTFGFGEETGWRGYALPSLQEHYDARKATLILGLLWFGWHIPLFTYQYQGITVFGLAGLIIGMLSGAVLLTWLYNSTSGSTLAVALWHGSYNACVAGTYPEISVIVTAAVIITAVWIGRRYGPENFSSKPRQKLGQM